MSLEKIFRWPEVTLALVAFFLNFFWEMIQSPLYDDVNQVTYAELLGRRLHCTIGDVLILLGAYWIVAWLSGSRSWIQDVHIRHIVGFTLLGLGYTVFSEWLNVDIRSAWGYADTMPRIPILGTGLAPLLQWLFVPAVVIGVVARVSHHGCCQNGEGPPSP